MNKPCNTCGDIGVFEAIAVCCECKDVREHLYCMKDVDTRLPEWWCCDECNPSSPSPSPLPSPEPIENEPKTQKVSILMQQTASLKDCPQKACNPSQLAFKEKWIRKGKTQYISCDEAVKLSSASVKPNAFRKEFGSPHRLSSSLTPTRVFQRSTGLKEKTIPFGCERLPFQSPQNERNVRSNLRQPVVQQSFCRKEKAVKFSMPSSRSVEGTKPEREMKTSKSELLHPKKAADISGLIEEVHKLFKGHEKTEAVSEVTVKSFMPSRRVEGPNPEREMTSKNELLHSKRAADIGGHIEEVPKLLKEHQKTETISGCKTNVDVEAAGKPNPAMLARAEQEIIHDLPVSEMHDPYIPSFNSYWKGCFNLPNGPHEFNQTFTGHLPSKTHYKVYETTKKLPENICFELVSNSEIRTEIFPADTDDIGLYFFPMSKTRSEHHIPIIDFIWKNNLVMKSNLDNLELLVLSSQVLPSHAQEFQGSYFLWGIFRRPKSAKKVADTRPLIVTNCALCADAPPGFERICRHATNRAPCVDVPPGFKRICR